MHQFLTHLIVNRCQSHPNNVLIINDNARLRMNDTIRDTCCDALQGKESGQRQTAQMQKSKQKLQQCGRDRRWRGGVGVKRHKSDSCLSVPERRSSKDSFVFPVAASSSDDSLPPAQRHFNKNHNNEVLSSSAQHGSDLVRWNSSSSDRDGAIVNKTKSLVSSVDTALDIAKRQRGAKEVVVVRRRPTITSTRSCDWALSIPRRLKSPHQPSKDCYQRLKNFRPLSSPASSVAPMTMPIRFQSPIQTTPRNRMSLDNC